MFAIRTSVERVYGVLLVVRVSSIMSFYIQSFCIETNLLHFVALVHQSVSVYLQDNGCQSSVKWFKFNLVMLFEQFYMFLVTTSYLLDQLLLPVMTSANCQ